MSELGRGQLRIAADSNYAAWINGQLVGTGQFSDFRERKTFSTFDVGQSLQPGRNVLAVLVHYCGQDHFSYLADEPGLWFLLQHGDDKIVSNERTQCRPCPSYQQGPIARISQQRGFSFTYDGRGDDDWTAVDYGASSDWQSAAATASDDTPQERPIPSLTMARRPAHEVIAQGLLRRTESAEATVAELMQRDFLSSRPAHELFDEITDRAGRLISRAVRISAQLSAGADGAYMVVDLGREECGFIDLELEAGAGTVVDIAVGEHLADLRVRAAVGGRNFASRYITGSGLQHFTHFAERYAGRYVQLHITNVSAPVTVRYAGLLPAEYPVTQRGQFHCPDSLAERIYHLSGRTLHLCMHERYEDCPWREQALYAEDARIEALVGYYVFGAYDFARVSLDLLGRSVEDDGYVQLCAPMRVPFKIPFPTMAWMLALAEYIRFSGDQVGVQEHVERAGAMLDTHCSRLIDGLLPCPQGKGYWHFYDWAEGLSGSIARSDSEALLGERFDAILNFLFILALEETAAIFERNGQRDLAQKYQGQAAVTRSAAHRMFWDPSTQSYLSYVGDQAIERHYAEMAQSLGLLARVPEQQTGHLLRSRLTQPNNGWVPTSLGASIYKYDAILAGPAEMADQAFDMVIQEWGPMIYEGATSFWETIKGQQDFSGAGSLCHGFSTIGAYVYQAHTLGIQPLEPGFARFGVRPVFGGLGWASGTVPTPTGDIEVSWEKQGSSYVGSLKHPESLQPDFADYGPECHWKVSTS